MRWYFDVLTNNYLNFNGRARRKEFWMYISKQFLRHSASEQRSRRATAWKRLVWLSRIFLVSSSKMEQMCKTMPHAYLLALLITITLPIYNLLIA